MQHQEAKLAGGGGWQRDARPSGGPRVARQWARWPALITLALEYQAQLLLLLVTPVMLPIGQLGGTATVAICRRCQRARMMRAVCLPCLPGQAACWPPVSPLLLREVPGLPTHLLGQVLQETGK